MSVVPAVERVVLVACGSYNPITNMHLRMFEIAKDNLQATGRYKVIRGIFSPVHDAYGKKDLAPALHRLAMCQLAVNTSDWIEVDDWELSQSSWTCTRAVLQHFDDHLNASQNKIECLRDAKDPSIESNAQRIRVMLLCGSDLLESFAKPGLWKREDIDALTRKFGLAVIRRAGSDADRFIYEHDTVYANRATVHVITEWLYNEISSTKVRKALRRAESVKYVLQDPVIDYIQRHGLYKE